MTIRNVIPKDEGLSEKLTADFKKSSRTLREKKIRFLFRDVSSVKPVLLSGHERDAIQMQVRRKSAKLLSPVDLITSN